jgi:uncharacterized protein with PIN domain
MFDRLVAGYVFRFRWLAALTPSGANCGTADALLAESRRRSATGAGALPHSLLQVYGEARERLRGALDAAGTASLLEALRQVTARAGGTLAGEARFAADGALGGVARWLRAAGYEARWSAGRRPLECVGEALTRGEILLTTDSRSLGFGAIRDHRLATLWLPSHLTRLEQLRLVLGDLDLAPHQPRCMACGGRLAPVDKEAVRPRIPPRTALWKDDYSACEGCGALYWEGTHWARIAEGLATSSAPRRV